MHLKNDMAQLKSCYSTFRYMGSPENSHILQHVLKLWLLPHHTRKRGNYCHVSVIL
ncbi:hypothetical protein PHAMO_400028 [Magnetospirillum molischianum DSM 120]|uniref:Uncharacterized protein n=1 Tax=Magnetospirillum molischianum DSM 120 TaxID=1150626 RepID=H8FWA9_MAGML|nr:hypothetical protein PHAMO_400028 [Magnetospirillum molischianum DSM 120]